MKIRLLALVGLAISFSEVLITGLAVQGDPATHELEPSQNLVPSALYGS
jgi:hypothetical protein